MIRVFLFIISLVCFSSPLSHGSAPKHKVVAITQIVAHPALDKIRQGILTSLAEAGFKEGENLTVLFENAHGNITTTLQIAQKFKGQNPDVVVGIATPSAQALANTFKGSKIPVVFAAVTDPENAGLTPEAFKGRVQITGTSDFPPVEQQIALIRKLLPQTQRIGVLYATGEVNAKKQVDTFKEYLNPDETLVEIPITSPVDLVFTLQNKIKDIDVLHIPLDNTVVANIKSVMALAKKHHIPVFTSHPEGVLEEGATGCVGVDQVENGRQTGVIVAKILKGIPADFFPITLLDRFETHINEEALA